MYKYGDWPYVTCPRGGMTRYVNDICIYMCIYIYIYKCIMYVYTYIYIYTHVYMYMWYGAVWFVMVFEAAVSQSAVFSICIYS